MSGVAAGSRRLAALALVVLVAGCAAPAPARSVASPPDSPAARAPLTRVRAAYVALTGNMLPAWIAADQGIYARYGLDVELTYITGAAKIAQALVAREIDVAIAPAEVAMGPGVEGADSVMIASWAYKMGFSLMGQPDIQSVADVRGKRIGVTRRGSNSDIWAAAVLEPFGLQPERDYSPLAVGGQFEQIAALQNGAIDVGVIGVPANLQARQLGFRDLLTPEQSVIDFADVGLVTTRGYLGEQPETIDRLLRGSAEGVAVIFNDAERTVDALKRYTDVEDRAQLEETLAFQRWRTTRDMLPTPAGLARALDELARGNPKAASAKPDDFVDLTAVRRLNESGFIQSLYPR